MLFRNRLRLRDILAGLISLTGIGCICFTAVGAWNIGDMLSLGFALVFGIQIVLTGRFVAKDTDSIRLSFFQFLTVAFLAGVIALIRREALLPMGRESLLGVLYLITLNTVAAFLLQNIAQKHVRDTTASLIISLESVFGFLFSLLYYREAPSLRLLLGACLCFAAILLVSLPEKRRTQ